MTNVSNHIATVKHRHVLLLQRGDEEYGVSSTVTDFALALLRFKLTVDIICVIEGSLSARLRKAGLNVDVLNVKPPARVITGNLMQRAISLKESKDAQNIIAQSVIQRLDGSHVDVVQSMNYLLLESCGLIAKAFNATGVWRMPSGVQSASLKKLKQFTMSRTCNKHKLISMANSDFTRQSIARNSPLSVVLYHGIDSARYNPDTVRSATREEFGISESHIVFGVFAHISPNGEKGQHLAVKALVRYLENSDDNCTRIHLVLFGDPIDSDYIQALRAEASTCEKLTLHTPGAVPDVERYYAIIDVSLSPRISPEPFGLSVVESMMMGVPVLAHAYGGPAETIVDDQTGWLVADATVEQWVSAFDRIMDERDKWPVLSAQARAHALEHFSIEAEVTGWAETLDDLTG